MAATNKTNNGSKNFYSITYGYFSSKVKDKPFEVDQEVTTEELKAKAMKMENLDLRKSFIKKDGDYPFQVFFEQIEGTITDVNTKQVDGIGKLLEIEVIDTDGDTNIITTKLYGKYSENFLNRFLNLDNDVALLKPYSIPSEYDTGNGIINYYNQGVVIYQTNGKILGKYEGKDLPEKDKVKDTNGNDKYANFTRVDFLLKEVKEKLEKIKGQPVTDKPAIAPVDPIDAFADDDLPF